MIGIVTVVPTDSELDNLLQRRREFLQQMKESLNRVDAHQGCCSTQKYVTFLCQELSELKKEADLLQQHRQGLLEFHQG